MNLAKRFYALSGINKAYIVLSYGQSNEGNAVLDWAGYNFGTGVYPDFPLPTSPVNFNTVDPTIKVVVDWAKPAKTTSGATAHTGVYRFENMEGSFWTADCVAMYGWEQTFLRKLRDRVNDTVYFVRVAHGGIGIGELMAGGAFYPYIAPSITFAIDSILAMGKEPVILLANWGQAESNQGDTNYRYELPIVIDYIRGVYPPYTNNIPFMLRKMSVIQTLFNGTVVNGEMDAVAIAKPNVYTYAPDDMIPAPTGYPEPGYGGGVAHYDGPTQLALGDYLFDLCLSNGIIA